MARLDKEAASEYGFNRFSRRLPGSALRTYTHLIEEIDELTDSGQPDVLGFRKKVVRSFNRALDLCYSLSVKDRFGRANEMDFWINLNNCLEVVNYDSFTQGMLREISSGISYSLGNDVRYIGMWGRPEVDQPGVRRAPHLNGEEYTGLPTGRYGNPFVYGLSPQEKAALLEDMESVGAQD